MFARRLILLAPTRAARPSRRLWHAPRRKLSTASQPIPQTSNNAAVIAGITSELDDLAPRIDITAEQIKILQSPKEFYATLKEKLRGAQKRIYLATLYIGKSEHELVSCIREALEKSPDLKVSILTDSLRGTREEPNPSCASLLSTLNADYPDRVEVRMYHTPNLTGLRKKYIPKRINEGWGLQHMKLYGIDDEVILSGANLSDDYFTNRQDRYHVFSSKPVSDFFSTIHNAMCSVSFKLRPGTPSTTFKLEWLFSNASPSPLVDPTGYVEASKKLFKQFTEPLPSQGSPRTGTSLYPLLIIPRAINNELPALERILSRALPSHSSYLFTAGYFNPHPSITASLLSAAKSGTNGTVVTASPWANGFYGSKGVSGMLPPAYTLLSRRFLKESEKTAPGAVELREWRLGTVGRPHGWTYHAKGLWLTLGGGATEKPVAGPSMTIIGSSNYTTRSYSLDAEVGAIIVTNDEKLQAQLKAEQENLLKYSKVVTEKDLTGGERRVGLGVRMAMWFVRAVGGSL
jgi:CDP-diacylglycerol--glycerol-3-phosphate 3-phosphatidyltransferase